LDPDPCGGLIATHRPILKVLVTLIVVAAVGAVLYGGAGALVGIAGVVAYLATRRAADWFGDVPDGDSIEDRSSSEEAAPLRGD
jgi:hypothetical protein